jgi:hypothetical protein
MKPETVYSRRKQVYEKLQEKQQQTANRLSNYRLYTSLAGLAASVVLYRAVSVWAAVAMGFATLLVFGYLAFQHQRVRRRLRYVEALVGINRRGLERATGQWAAFADTGAEFRDDGHPYATDLDLFGQASLFQWVSSATTPLGRETLARVLTDSPKDRSEILARQEAVTELARKLTWRQRFEAEGLLASERLEPTEPLLQWATESYGAYLHPFVKLGVRVLPVLTILVVALYFFQQAIPWQVPLLFVLLHSLLMRVNGKERGRVLSLVYRYDARLGTYSRILELFEGQKFNAPWLVARQGRLRDGAGRSAYEQVHKLSKIAERISNRENAMFLILNILLLWDYQCMIALGEWKAESGKRLRAWLDVLAETEALSSLANIRFEHADWAMPALTEETGQVAGGPGAFAARKLGHPLITRSRVANDFALQAPSQISVLTGSNMSGKSTFLRTIGINLVLAYAGAPVCAEQFRCSLMNLWTSMRTTDNLEQSISSFYAEILRIKQIVEAASTAKPVCFLLDEVFKGTNSYDRHQGAKALIAQLQRAGAVGLVSTHDLELGDLEDDSDGRIKNYHFREYYQDGEIRFDYILRRGISTTRNALYLIRMMGIEVEEA